MIFLNPFWLLLLIPIGLWAWWIFKSGRKNKFVIPYSDLSLMPASIVSEGKEEKILLVLKILSLAVFTVALARPQKVFKSNVPPKPVVDMILCLDTSGSMAALDFNPDNRLDAAKKAAEEFIGKRSPDRIGLVVFGGRAITQCPLTLDHETLIDFLRTVSLNATQTEGTAIGNAIALSADQLSKSEAKTKIIILLTDGRSNVGTLDPMTAAQAASELGIKIYTIGSAVPGGGLIPVEDPIFGKRLVRMEEDLDETSLLEMARITSAKYFRVTSPKRFTEIYKEIDSMEKTKVEVDTSMRYDDQYVIFAVVALLLLVMALMLENTIWRTIP